MSDVVDATHALVLRARDGDGAADEAPFERVADALAGEVAARLPSPWSARSCP